MLVLIDVISRFAWVEPMKSKSGPETTKALQNILNRSDGRKPQRLQTDKGTEFYNSNFKQLLKKYDIHLYSTDSDTKAAIAERFIRTLKELIIRYMDDNNTSRYVDVLQNLVLSYNKTYHCRIKMAPIDVDEKNLAKVLKNLYGFMWKKDLYTRKKSKLNLNDKVRISSVRHPFKKGYEGYWSEEIFTISKIKGRHPRSMYQVKDDNGEIVKGYFYSEELQKVKIKESGEYWRVEKILKQEFRKKKLWYYVKWLNYEKPSWIPASNIVDAEKVKSK